MLTVIPSSTNVTMDRLATRLLGAASIALAGLVLLASEAHAQRGLDLETDTLTQSVLIHPPIDVSENNLTLATGEHEYRSQLGLGDQLARDFMAAKVGEDGISRPYKPGTDGERNEDWYGWREDVLAPFSATVAQTVEPDTTNTPGSMNRGAQPGVIIFEDNTENISAVYVHVREIAVEEGQSVSPGEVVGKVGNNATSRSPHIHIGAWKGDASDGGAEDGTPLQIQVDLYAEERHGEDTAGQ